MADAIVAEPHFKEIPGLEGYYATADGEIWSCWKRGCRSEKTSNKRRLKQRPHIRSGHPYVVTRFKGTNKYRMPVHRAVLMAFVGLPPKGMECRHLNGIASDNRIENLAWGTRKENVADSIKHGTFFAACRQF